MGQGVTLRNTLLLCCLLGLLVMMQGSQALRAANRRAGRRARANLCKDKTMFSVSAGDLQKRPMTLKCRQGPVVKLEMQSLKGKCKGTSGFSRYIVRRCLWNDTCHVTYRRQFIDSLAPTVKDKACLGQTPDTFEMGYSCLKKKVQVMDTLGTFKRTKKQAGMVRSHEVFPWGYRNGDPLGNVTFLRPGKHHGLTLWISVYFYNLLIGDFLFLSWDEPAQGEGQRVSGFRQLMPNDTLVKLPAVRAVTLTFYVEYQKEYPQPYGAGNAGRGFLLCYQWLKPSKRPKKNSACSKVITQGKCKNRKRRTRRRKTAKSTPRNRKRPRKGARNTRPKGARNTRPKGARNSRPKGRPNARPNPNGPAV